MAEVIGFSFYLGFLAIIVILAKYAEPLHFTNKQEEDAHRKRCKDHAEREMRRFLDGH